MSCLNLNIFVLKSRYSYNFKTIILTVDPLFNHTYPIPNDSSNLSMEHAQMQKSETVWQISGNFSIESKKFESTIGIHEGFMITSWAVMTQSWYITDHSWDFIHLVNTTNTHANRFLSRNLFLSPITLHCDRFCLP